MRRPVDRLLRRLWSDEPDLVSGALSLALLPASALYRAVVHLRSLGYDRGWLRSVRPRIPVISVGNLLVGGTGKTPVSAWAARVLADAGRKPALVSRGYGEDELALHRRWNPDVPVVAGANRPAAVERAAAGDRDVAVLDDGFQHRRLARDLDVALLPAEGPWTDRVLPRGPFREPLSAVARADWAVLTRRTAPAEAARTAECRLRRRFPGLRVAHLELVVRDWTTLDGEAAEEPRGPLVAVSGVARPRSVADLVRRTTGSTVELVAFPDHHVFTDADVGRIVERVGSRTLVTTEKDAVRLSPHADRLADVRVLRLSVAPGPGGGALRNAIVSAAESAP